MSETDPFVGSAGFYRRLEACLGQLVDQRQQQYARIAPMNVRCVEKAVRDVLERAAGCGQGHGAAVSMKPG